jgi:hypothetical protein
LGEATGHHHSLMAAPGAVLDDVASMFEVDTGDGKITYLRVTGDGVSLVHQEHKAHAVPPGEYQVVIQQENTDWGAQPVRD